VNVVVGCPVVRREWIIDRWAEAAVASAAQAGHHPSFLVVADARDPTIEVLAAAASRLRVEVTHVPIDEPRDVDERDWCPPRYVRMAELRNTLLAAVRALGPDLFWSLDSDIIAHPEAFTVMQGLLDAPIVASSTCCYLSHNKSSPNYANFVRPSERLDRRYQPGVTITVDVIMANKLMTPAAYTVDYLPHQQGEDAGWCRNVRAAGGRLKWAAEPVSKHVQDRRQLDLVDDRCGY
jgi:hypothetical protein